jgi:PAS domain S-box-containing protein
LARGEDWEGIIDAFDAEGRRFTLWEQSSSVRDTDGKMVSVFGFMQDVTERQREEDELRNREAFLKTLLEAIPLPIFYSDSRGRYMGFNEAFEMFIGIPRDQLIGRSMFDIRPKEIKESYHVRDEDLIELGGYQQYESQVMDARGDVRDVVFSKAAVSDREGNVNGLVGTIFDITEQRRMERLAAEITEAERIALRRELHDTICQQLAVAGILADHLREDLADSPEGNAERIDEIASIIRKSLDEAHLIGRQMEPLSDSPDALITSLEDLVDRIKEFYGVRCRVTSRKRIELNNRSASIQLSLIAQEAAINAAKHADPTRISISVSRRGRTVTLRVQDDGKGIPKKEGEEKGMGIKIMHERAELIGGKLSLRRAAKGGTVLECVWKPPQGQEV